MMPVHVLHAGDGYTYLTRQVASGDHQSLRGEALSDYYTAEATRRGGGSQTLRRVSARPWRTVCRWRRRRHRHGLGGGSR